MLRSAALAALLTLAACSGASDGQESAVEPQTWPDKWCKVQVGMTAQEAVAIMGEPTERFPDSMKWAAFEYRYSAFLNADGTVRQLDMDQALEERSWCQATRT